MTINMYRPYLTVAQGKNLFLALCFVMLLPQLQAQEPMQSGDAYAVQAATAFQWYQQKDYYRSALLYDSLFNKYNGQFDDER